MAFSINEAGELVELTEQTVDEAAVTQQLQEELDAAQNEVNAHQVNVANAEQVLADVEAQADAANKALEELQANLEAAQSRLQKSTDKRTSLTAALELRNAQPRAEAEEADDSDSSESTEDTEPTEAVEVPINVVAAEG